MYVCVCVHLVNTLLKDEESARYNRVLACNFAKYSPILIFFHSRLSNKPFLIWSLTTPHTHTRLTALCPGLPGTRKVKSTWILLKQETVSGSVISWAICKSAPRSRQPRQHPTTQFFTGRMPFLPPNQQRQSTGKSLTTPPHLIYAATL